MSNFEIVIIVLACAIPLVALFYMLPKIKKKDKKKIEEQTKTLEELKKEEKQETNMQEIKKDQPIKKEYSNSEISSDEIQSYVDYKKKNTTKPQRVELPKNFKDVTLPYMPRRRKSEKKPQSVAEEIRNLSPELKILMISGVLEPKNFDKF